MKSDHRSKFPTLQLEGRSLKNIRASTGFELVAFAMTRAKLDQGPKADLYKDQGPKADLYKRYLYIDDCVGATSSSREELNLFITSVNSFHPG